MSEFDNPAYPFLTNHDEEYWMLKDYVDEYQKQKSNSKQYKSGNATLNVIHNYLIGKDIRLPKNPKVKIKEVKTRMNLLYLLKGLVNQNQSDYSVHDLDAVLKISNNAVGSSKENTPSEHVRNTFEKFRQQNENLRFCVVVLVESPNYKNRFQDAFVLVFRNPEISKVVYDDADLIDNLMKKNQLKKTRKWEELLTFLKRISSEGKAISSSFLHFEN
jgi:hypothetical protein